MTGKTNPKIAMSQYAKMKQNNDLKLLLRNNINYDLKILLRIN